MARLRWWMVALWCSALGCFSSSVKSQGIEPRDTRPTTCASAPSADSTVYDSTDVAERPVPRSVPVLEYPAAARRERVQGHAAVTAVVNADGTVDSASITRITPSQPSLDAAVRRIVGQTTFWPACRDGVAVRARIAVALDFKLTGDPAGTVFAAIAGVWAGVMAAVMH